MIAEKQKSRPLAPIAVEILISRGSAYKIVTDSGTMFPKNTKSFLLLNQLIYQSIWAMGAIAFATISSFEVKPRFEYIVAIFKIIINSFYYV